MLKGQRHAKKPKTERCIDRFIFGHKNYKEFKVFLSLQSLENKLEIMLFLKLYFF